MPYMKKPINRDQVVITTFDALVAPNSTARIIDHFINNVDLDKMGFKNTIPAIEGKPSYPPANMAKMYLYGYRNNIRSSRKLQQACKVNIEVKWLMEGLEPNHSAIADFRKDNIDCLKELYHEFARRVTVDIETGDVSIDGSKFKAWNSKENNFTIQKLEERIEWLEDHSEEYLRLIEISDENEDALEGDFTREELEQKLKDTEERLEKYRGYRRIMEERGLSQLSLTDADSRLMKMKNGMDVAYNVQTAIDTKTHMMLDYNMTNKCTDHGQLAPTMEYIKGQHPGEIKNAIADKGYHRDTDYIECLENGIIPNVIPEDGNDFYELEIAYEENECDPSSTEATELARCLHAGIIPDAYKDCISDIEVKEVRYKPEDAKRGAEPQNPGRTIEEMKARAKEGYFVRNPEANCVYCPSGATLYQKSIKQNGNIRYCNKKLCKQCPYKAKCVTSKKYPWKEIDFTKDGLEKKAKWWNDDKPTPPSDDSKTDKKNEKKEPSFHFKKRVVVKFKLRPNREKMDKRKETSEHPFGTIKRWQGSDYFLLKGMRKVDGEFALFGMAYNLSRAENMFTFDELMERVGRKIA